MEEDGLNYVYAVTMDEVLELLIEHAETVRNTSDMLRQGVYLKMASKALECAMRIYGSQLPQEVQKEGMK
jgi:hypothetical protein